MSYRFISDDVPLDLINKFNIPISQVIRHTDVGEQDVANNFVESIVEVVWKIEKLLKTNIPIIMSDDHMRRHNSKF